MNQHTHTHGKTTHIHTHTHTPVPVTEPQDIDEVLVAVHMPGRVARINDDHRPGFYAGSPAFFDDLVEFVHVEGPAEGLVRVVVDGLAVQELKVCAGYVNGCVHCMCVLLDDLSVQEFKVCAGFVNVCACVCVYQCCNPWPGR
jgi:hypothetical protein